MLRVCDGSDPLLLQLNKKTEKYESCACGLQFDDEYFATIYPHWNFKAAKQLAADILMWDKELEAEIGKG